MTTSQSLFNPEAGYHPIPDDAREIAAVLRATGRCYEDHPYFFARYGERGVAFANSDGGYLTTLASHPQSHIDAQVAWLGRMLACRGMPRWLLEVHLDFLADELSTAIPERAAAYEHLYRAAGRLRDERQAVISQADFAEQAAQFSAAAGAGLENAGGLLIAAVCDECVGLAKAVPSLIDWLGNPTRFSSSWCNAVAETLARAHILATPVQGSQA